MSKSFTEIQLVKVTSLPDSIFQPQDLMACIWRLKFVRSIWHGDICGRSWMLLQTSVRISNNVLYFPYMLGLIISTNPPPVKKTNISVPFHLSASATPTLWATSSHQSSRSDVWDFWFLNSNLHSDCFYQHHQDDHYPCSPAPIHSSGKPYFCPLPNGAPWPGENWGVFWVSLPAVRSTGTESLCRVSMEMDRLVKVMDRMRIYCRSSSTHAGDDINLSI